MHYCKYCICQLQVASGRLHKLMSNNYDLIIIPAMDWVKELIKRSKQRYPQIGNAIAKLICANLSIHRHILVDGECNF